MNFYDAYVIRDIPNVSLEIHRQIPEEHELYYFQETELLEKALEGTIFQNESPYELLIEFLAKDDDTAIAYMTKHTTFFEDCKWTEHTEEFSSGWCVKNDGIALVIRRHEIDDIPDDALESMFRKSCDFIRMIFEKAPIFENWGYIITDTEERENEVVAVRRKS